MAKRGNQEIVEKKNENTAGFRPTGLMRGRGKRIFAVCGLGILSVLALLSACSHSKSKTADFQLRTELVRAIGQGHEVVAIEHSCIMDLYNAGLKPDENYQETVFQRVTLSDAQRRALLKAMPRTQDRSAFITTFCIFEPHHRIEVKNAKGEQTLSWEICFSCGEHAIDGADKKILPTGWAKSLSGFFKDVGMTPYNGPWVIKRVKTSPASQAPN